MSDISAIHNFLKTPTPTQWIEQAIQPKNLSILLIDHANCEKKAASTALNLMYRYTDNFVLLNKMSRLAREELRHFEQVVKIMQQRAIEYNYISASRYAEAMRKQVRKAEPNRLIDTLIVGAIIEARSCERFHSLAPELDNELSEFYTSLLKSEARHFTDYLRLAETVDKTKNIEDRVELFLQLDSELINTKDTEFRFHSGVILPIIRSLDK